MNLVSVSIMHYMRDLGIQSLRLAALRRNKPHIAASLH